LKNLFLHKNDLRGAIPPEIGDLKRLGKSKMKTITMSSNLFSKRYFTGGKQQP